jgi:3-oxoacyl-[acyl-carrier protein] reductase
VAEAGKAYGGVDVLVAAAGVLGPEKPVTDVTDAEWDDVLAVNLTGVLHCCQAVLPAMLDQEWGRIVIMTSHARHGVPERIAYGVSKAGVTAIAGAIGGAYDPDYLANPPGVAIGRMAQPEEIAEVIAFLCSPQNSYAVGAIWEATGGLTTG